MQRKSGSRLTVNPSNPTNPWKRTRRAIWAMLLVVTLVFPYAVLAVDEDCDPASPTFNSPADNLCVPALQSSATILIDAFDTEWAANTFYDHTEYWPNTIAGRVRVSRRATGINKSDLLLFFEATGDPLTTLADEINIGLNPGTNEANSTLIRIKAFPGGSPTAERRTFNTGTRTWDLAGSNEPWYSVATRAPTGTSNWFAEVRISLDAIPGSGQITGTDFRLYLELLADDGATPIIYQWPDQSLAPTHNFICSNPQRWHPMSFATGTGGNCPHPDLNIANGLYSCGDVYILRSGAKSTEIALNQMNEFHADVTNPAGSPPATNAEVYLTLSSLGIGTPPQAMNYSHTDAAIVAFFNAHFGTWMTAGASLTTGTPRPPVPFTVNPGTNTAARFTWQPSLEPGTPADFVGHRCTAAFVNFKDDPNFANNFSYCNTSIVTCPTGEICPMAFAIGQVYPRRRPREDMPARIVVNVFNEPFPGWFNQGRFNLEGGGVKRVNERVFEAVLPVKGEVPLKVSFTPPRGRGDSTPSPKYPTPSPRANRNQNLKAHAEAPPKPQPGNDSIKERDDRLKRIYGDRPMIVVQGFVPAGFKTGADGKGQMQVYAPTSYVAFVVDTPGTKPPPKKKCGKATGQTFALASLIALFGIAFTWRRTRRRTKAGKTTKNE